MGKHTETLISILDRLDAIEKHLSVRRKPKWRWYDNQELDRLLKKIGSKKPTVQKEDAETVPMVPLEKWNVPQIPDHLDRWVESSSSTDREIHWNMTLSNSSKPMPGFEKEAE